MKALVITIGILGFSMNAFSEQGIKKKKDGASARKIASINSVKVSGFEACSGAGGGRGETRLQDSNTGYISIRFDEHGTPKMPMPMFQHWSLSEDGSYLVDDLGGSKIAFMVICDD